MSSTFRHATISRLYRRALCALLLGAAANTTPLFADENELSGTIEAEVNGEVLQFPSLKTNVEVDLSGDLARVRVTQTFENPLQTPIHARYLFPLNKNAAVFGLTMKVGNELIKATIKEKAVAKKIFTQAKQAGKAAALLTQQRPNMFTQRIANLLPNLPIEVIIEYTEALTRVDDAYELVVPLVVGPRYNPSSNLIKGLVVDQLQQLPSQPSVIGVDLPSHIKAERVSIKVNLTSANGFSNIASATHDIDINAPDASRRAVTLTRTEEIPNRDFVLRYRLGNDANTTAGLLGYADERGGFFSMLLEPPTNWLEESVTPREMVFLLDCSGSMNGTPLNASKRFMESALQNLRPTDTFRIIRFSDRATEFSSKPLIASPTNIATGIRYTKGLRGSGGTVMSSGIQQALSVPKTDDVVRNVVFLTDGYIGNEIDILRLVATQLGDARLYALGVGTSVNRYLLDELGRVGRGFVRYLDPTKAIDQQADALAARLQTPLLTDITVDWGQLQPTSLNPQAIPDLYAGDSVRVQGRYADPGQYRIVVNGYSGGNRVVLPLDVDLPAPNSVAVDTGTAIPLIWARGAIKDAMHQLSVPQHVRADQQTDDFFRSLVTELGLEYSLVTRWTSFVAVSKQIYNPDAPATPELGVPQAKVKGVSNLAYAKSPHGGFAAPEPGTWAGIGLLMLMLTLLARTRTHAKQRL